MVLPGCEPTVAPTETPLARVGEQYLYAHDLDGLVSEGVSNTDSAALARRYVRAWVRQQLLLARAEAQPPPNRAALRRRLLEYRYDLIRHEFEKDYVATHLDTVVTPADLQAYYDTHRDNFVLREPVAQGWFVRVPVGAPGLDSLTEWARENQTEALREYARGFADHYVGGDSTWRPLADYVRDWPEARPPETFLRGRRYFETENDAYVYFLRLTDYQPSEAPAPLTYVRSRLRGLVLNRRRADLLKTLEEEIYRAGEANQTFEIYE